MPSHQLAIQLEAAVAQDHGARREPLARIGHDAGDAAVGAERQLLHGGRRAQLGTGLDRARLQAAQGLLGTAIAPCARVGQVALGREQRRDVARRLVEQLDALLEHPRHRRAGALRDRVHDLGLHGPQRAAEDALAQEPGIRAQVGATDVHPAAAERRVAAAARVLGGVDEHDAQAGLGGDRGDDAAGHAATHHDDVVAAHATAGEAMP